MWHLSTIRSPRKTVRLDGPIKIFGGKFEISFDLGSSYSGSSMSSFVTFKCDVDVDVMFDDAEDEAADASSDVVAVVDVSSVAAAARNDKT